MSKPPAQPAPRSNAEYRWTRDKGIAFLRALTTLGSVAAAARSVGMSRKAAYALRARQGVAFAAAWDASIEFARARRRAARRDRYRAVAALLGDGLGGQGYGSGLLPQGIVQSVDPKCHLGRADPPAPASGIARHRAGNLLRGPHKTQYRDAE